MQPTTVRCNTWSRWVLFTVRCNTRKGRWKTSFYISVPVARFNSSPPGLFCGTGDCLTLHRRLRTLCVLNSVALPQLPSCPVCSVCPARKILVPGERRVRATRSPLSLRISQRDPHLHISEESPDSDNTHRTTISLSSLSRVSPRVQSTTHNAHTTASSSSRTLTHAGTHAKRARASRRASSPLALPRSPHNHTQAKAHTTASEHTHTHTDTLISPLVSPSPPPARRVVQSQAIRGARRPGRLEAI